MKSPHLAFGLIGLALVGLWCLGGGTRPLSTARAEGTPSVQSLRANESFGIDLSQASDAPPNSNVITLPQALGRSLLTAPKAQKRLASD